MTPAFGHLRIFDSPEALARGTADWLCEEAVKASQRFVLALSGGSTPKRLYEVLAEHPYRDRFPWNRTEFLFGDERFVPPDSPESNARMAREAMLSHVPVRPEQVHLVPTVGLDAEAAAAAYESTLKQLYGRDSLDPAHPLIDVNLLGLGEDGHTASLIPGEPVLDERVRWVGVVAHGRPETRITLTYPVLESSRFAVFLVQGAGKREILDRILAGDDTLPAARLRPAGEILWLVDEAAAGRWAA